MAKTTAQAVNKRLTYKVPQRLGLEVTSLKLFVQQEDKEFDFPILALTIQYSVREFPLVSVTISTASKKNRSAKTLGMGADEFGGKLARVIMEAEPFMSRSAAVADTTKSFRKLGTKTNKLTIPMFCGYIISDQSSFVTNNVTVGSVRELRLVCAAESLDTMPLGGVSYYGDAPNNGKINHSIDFLNLSSLYNPVQTEKNGAKLQNENFNIKPAEFLVDCVDLFYAFATTYPRANTQNAPDLWSSVIVPKFTPTFKVTGNIQQTIETNLALALQSNGTASVLHMLLNQFMLDWVPQTMSGTDTNTRKNGKSKIEACRMIIRPLNAWSGQKQGRVQFILSPEMFISIFGGVEYKLNNIVDCWCVAVPPSPGDKNLDDTTLAVYCPGLGGKKGQATLVAAKQISAAANAARDKQQKSLGTIPAFITARTVALPGWMVGAAINDVQQRRPQNNRTGSTSQLTVTKYQAYTDRLVEMAKRLAVASFLTGGRDNMRLTAKIPFWVWLQLLPCLGTVGQLFVPEASGIVTASRNAEELPASEYFGMLHSLQLRIELTNKSFNTNCTAVFSSIRDPELQAQYAADDVFYTEDKPFAGQEEALALSDALYKMMNLKRK